MDQNQKTGLIKIDPFRNSAEMSNTRPDIYHILLDAYSRSDVLKDAYGFDNGPFIQALKKRGFNVGENSIANYSGTDLSLTSTLNFNYLDSLFVNPKSAALSLKKMESLRNTSKASRVLLSRGYRWKVVAHGWENTFPINADIIQPPRGFLGALNLNEFQNGLLAMTPVPNLLGALGCNTISPNTQHRNRILFALDYLMQAPMDPGPQYVFCHILAPHAPIVFGPKGELREDIPDLNTLRKTDKALFRKSVVDEISYLNTRLLTIVDKIIHDSKGEAVILIHSDHGESILDFSDDIDFLHQRHGILAALYLPGGAQESGFSAGISPVNFYRIIFNHLFNSNLPLLKDRVFYSHRKAPFAFREITDTLNFSGIKGNQYPP